jgi:tRNA uridine 5-carboxymethylaminomethyl modification enzyme
MAETLGLLSDEQRRAFEAKHVATAQLSAAVHDTTIAMEHPAVNALLKEPMQKAYRLSDLVKRPEVGLADLLIANQQSCPAAEVVERVEIEIKYQGYIDRQKQEIERLRSQQNLKIPLDFDYSNIQGLSNEVRQKLGDIRPENLGQAARISGVTPAALSLLLVYLKRKGGRFASAAAV